MGHLRLGRLPKTRHWIEVVQLLDASPEDTLGIAASVVTAADQRLKHLGSDKSLGYCFWLLTRIAEASHNPDFARTLAGLGIEVDSQTTVASFISKVTQQVHDENDRNIESGHFSELSSLALRRALSGLVVQHTGTYLVHQFPTCRTHYLLTQDPINLVIFLTNSSQIFSPALLSP
jgi:hypothetical protein